MIYYNEIDPKASAWLRELISAGLIPAGHVDTRSIADVQPSDLDGFAQCHFFAGIGGWAYALRLAGWPDDEPVWTGSCPCQPFSAAGKQRGTSDERHLWPELARLVAKCRPSTVFGEQVASKLGRQWLAGVRVDLEGMGYAVGAADLCAAGCGAPHIRQRLYWVADSNEVGLRTRRDDAGEQELPKPFNLRNSNGGLEHATGDGRSERRAEPSGGSVVGGCGVGGMGDANGAGSQSRRQTATTDRHRGPAQSDGDAGGLAYSNSGRDRADCSRADFGAVPPTDGGNYWSRFDIIPCRDGKARRFEPGSFPLAHGVSGRVGLLRGYGNAIVPQVAAEFIRAFCEARNEVTPGLALS